MVGGVSSRARELMQELTSNPFFPLLFIGKAAETSAFWTVGEASANVVGVSYAMAVVSVIGWLYTYEDVAWGVEQVTEAAEDINEEE